MKKLRRIEVAPAAGAYAQLGRGELRYIALPEAEFRAIERERPGLIVTEGDAVLVGRPRAGLSDLQYAFRNQNAFVRRFPPMLQRLLPELSVDEAPFGVRFRLLERSLRPYVEPVLFVNAFEPAREWCRMTLTTLPEGGKGRDEVAPGFLLRPARREDVLDIVAIDVAAFPPALLTPTIVEEQMAERHLFRMLEETSTGHIVGFLHLRLEETTTGYVSDIALHQEYHRRGLGEATMRWALGWFRSEGLRSVALTVSTDNAPAIALYRKLGFEAGEVGLDYRRPVDEDEVRQVLEKHRAQHITVRSR